MWFRPPAALSPARPTAPGFGPFAVRVVDFYVGRRKCLAEADSSATIEELMAPSLSTERTKLRRRLLTKRSRGERAFDRLCFWFVAFPLIVLFAGFNSFNGGVPMTSTAIGVAGFALVLWSLLLWGVVTSWRDPAARVLRFSSSCLLLVAAVILICSVRTYLILHHAEQQ